MTRADAARVHGAVLLFGLAGLFGKWLRLPPHVIVTGRTAFAAAGLLAFALATRALRRPSWETLALGALLAAHWVTFFAAIQHSTVAVGVLSFATFPAIVVLAEPLREGRRPRASALLAAALALAGVSLVVPAPDLHQAHTRGAALGVLSGALFAALTLGNRRAVTDTPPVCVALWQNLTACLLLLPFSRASWPLLRGHELWLLALLGVVFTGAAHALFIAGMRTVSAATASLAASLEPLYAVVAAGLLLGERPGARVLAGGGVILLAQGLARRSPPAPRGPRRPPGVAKGIMEDQGGGCVAGEDGSTGPGG